MYYGNNPEPLQLHIILKKVKGEKAIEKQLFPFTLSFELYNELIENLFPAGDEVYKVDDIYTNFGIDFIDENKQLKKQLGLLEVGTKLDNLIKGTIQGFCKIQFILQTINAFATASEVQAIVESITNNLEEISDLVVAGKYHFFNGASIKNDDFVCEIAKFKKIDNIVASYEYDEEFFEDDYKHNLKIFAEYGYFETSTGVIYIEPNTPLYEKAKQKYDNKIMEMERK